MGGFAAAKTRTPKATANVSGRSEFKSGSDQEMTTTTTLDLSQALHLSHEVTLETHAIHEGEAESSSSSSEEDDIQPSRWAVAKVTAKNIFSAALLVFCMTMLVATIFTRQTRATASSYGTPPAAAFVALLFALGWLALIEGGLNCLVGLRPLDPAVYKDSHPLAYRATKIGHKGKNLDRFIVGRQYMDLTLVFTISFLASAVPGASVLGLPDLVCACFLQTGIAMTLVTIVLGQLALQINAANCMLDYMNGYAMLVSTYLALAVEGSGICHVVYLVQRIVQAIHRYKNKRAAAAAAREAVGLDKRESTASPSSVDLGAITVDAAATITTTTKPQRSKTALSWTNIAFWFRILLSTSLLCFALVTVFVATFHGDTKMVSGVPGWASLLLFVFLILLVGMFDALQIALMAVVHIPQDQLEHCPTALANTKYVIQGNRLQSFLLGRQIGQTVVQFWLARLTTLNIPLEDDRNIWGVPDMVQKLFNGGLLGAIIATVLASLIWRVLASEFPLAFLNLPIAKPIIWLCLEAEHTGVINIAWSLAALHRRVTGLRPDQEYLDEIIINEDNESHYITVAICDKQKMDLGASMLMEDSTLRCNIDDSDVEDPCTTHHR